MNLLDAAKAVLALKNDDYPYGEWSNEACDAHEALERAVAEIGEVMVDTEIVLNDEQWKSFQEMLDGATQDKPKLAKLLREPSVLEARGIEDLIAEIDELITPELHNLVAIKDVRAILDKYRNSR